MYAPVVASTEAERVVADLAPDVPEATRRYVTGMVNKMGLSPAQIRGLSQDAEGIEYIQNMAYGHASRQAKNAPIPKTTEPGARDIDDFQVPANQKSNMEEYVSTMVNMGVPRADAVKTFKQTLKAGRN